MGVTTINLQRYNPHKSFRAGQEKAIQQMIELYEDGQKIIELNAPTAAGKTACLYVFGRVLEKEYGANRVVFTSPQVALITEGNLFDLPKLVGKRNYKCAAIKDYTAEDCPFSSQEDGFVACEKCLYRHAKYNFMNSGFGAVTFARYSIDPSIYTKTDNLLIDESSELEGQLIDKATIELNLNLRDITNKKSLADQVADLQRFLSTFDVKPYMVGLRDSLHDEAGRFLKQYDDFRKTVFDGNKRRPTSQEMKKLRHLKMEYEHVRKQEMSCENALRYLKLDVPYVLTCDVQDVWVPSLRRKEKKPVPYFKLLDAHVPFGDLVANLDCVVLASGTPTTELVTTKHRSVVVPHPIPKDRRLIFYDPVGSMNYQNRDRVAAKMAHKIQQLHDTFCKHTLVHCGSYYVAELIHKNLHGGHVVCQDPNDREGSFVEWKTKPEGIFLSVRYEEGISLDGPEYPMNIIAKIPFPNLSDSWVNERNRLDKWFWYEFTTACRVQQACGRTTRSPDDYSQTYILDESFGNFYNRNKGYFLPWFREALISRNQNI